MNIRYATMADLDDIASVEAECFPVLEAATKEEFEQRIKYYGNLQMRCMKMHLCIMRMVHGR